MGQSDTGHSAFEGKFNAVCERGRHMHPVYRVGGWNQKPYHGLTDGKSGVQKLLLRIRADERGSGPALRLDLFLLRRFPQLDAIPFRVHDPCEPAIFMIFPLWIDGYAFGLQRFEHGVEIFYLVVDHEGRTARIEVFRILGEKRPHGKAFVRRIVVAAPVEHRAYVRFALDTEMTFVPFSHFPGVLRLYTNTPHA